MFDYCVGPGTGASLSRRFAQGGYRVAMLARTQERLSQLEKEIAGSRGYVCDVSDEAAVNATVARVKAEMGAPEILIHNAVGGAFGTFLEIEPQTLSDNFQVNTMGLLYLARAVAPDMIAAGKGVILSSGNTSALRGNPVLPALPQLKRLSASSPSPWPAPWGPRASTSPISSSMR